MFLRGIDDGTVKDNKSVEDSENYSETPLSTSKEGEKFTFVAISITM